MTYKGRYFPTNPKKYRGNPNQIIYRSLWERKVMVYCDKNDAIIEWGSEEVIVPYLSPMDGKIHINFKDIYMLNSILLQYLQIFRGKHGSWN